MSPPHLFSVVEVAQTLGLTRETVCTYIRDFKTPPPDFTFGYQRARGWLSLEQWIEWYNTPGTRGLKHNAKEYSG